jgi:8-oxo-dGTP diphosphatase
MIYLRETYEIERHMYEAFNTFFHTYVLPNQLKHGVKLVGRWVTADKKEITTMWEYPSYEAYEHIEHNVHQDPLHTLAQEERKKLSNLYISQKQDFLEATGTYTYPTHTVAVTGLIRNENGEALLVRTKSRNDSWEGPGGQVERGETLEEAFRREVKEETGVDIVVGEMIGVYQVVERSVYIIMFQATCTQSEIAIQPNEIEEAAFVPLTMDNVAEYMTRPGMRRRLEDALQGKKNVYCAYTVDPYKVVAETKEKQATH